MADSRKKRPPAEAIVDLRRRLSALPDRHPERAELVKRAASFYGLSPATIYRTLREHLRPKPVRRVDLGTSHVGTVAEMERYCEIIAAMKVRTSNRKRRHLSTGRAIELLETFGVETPEGLVRAPAGLLKRPTIDRLMRKWGYDHRRIVQPGAAVRFQARRSNELWQFDLSPSRRSRRRYGLSRVAAAIRR